MVTKTDPKNISSVTKKSFLLLKNPILCKKASSIIAVKPAAADKSLFPGLRQAAKKVFVSHKYFYHQSVSFFLANTDTIFFVGDEIVKLGLKHNFSF